MPRSPARKQLHFQQSFSYLICFIYVIAVVILFWPYLSLKRFELSSQASVANGFHEILSDTGVKVFRQDYSGQAPDFVTIVDLPTATIRNLTGAVNDESIDRKTLREFWRDAVSDNQRNLRAQVVINGSFFGNGSTNTTAMAFGLKVRNRIINYGYGLNEYPGLNKTLAFHSFAAFARLEDYTVQTFNSAIPDVVGALAPQADKSAAQRLGRTFAGIIDQDRDAIPETVLFFASARSTQANAASVLRRFGATATAMLDGGGSTGLIVGGIDRISTDRTLPHAIAIYAGKPENPIVSEAENDKCLNASGFPGFFSALTLSNCNGSTSQQWSLIKDHLRTANGQCLEASQEESNQEGTVQLRRCSQSPNQRWTYADGALQAANNQCLDAGESTVSRDAEVRLRPCSGSLFQQWRRID